MIIDQISRLDLNKSRDKNSLIEEVKRILEKSGFRIVEENKNKPWGAYLRIDEKQIEEFVKIFFKDLKIDDSYQGLKLYPKILLVEPEKRLSYQYHFRRAEYWKVIGHRVGIVKSKTDKVNQRTEVYQIGELIKLPEKIRHRLVGLDKWGGVAEIWVHTDPSSPSNEEDIVRVADDFGR